MSPQSAHEPSTLGRVASRRGVVRGAAWSGAAVTIVVATPNIAAASTTAPGPTLPPEGTTATLSIQRSSQDANVHFVTWVIRITNTGIVAIDTPTGTFGGVSGVTALTVTSDGGTWTGTDLSTRTFSGSIPAGTYLDITVVFRRSKNSTGTATASFLSGSTAIGSPLSATYS